MTLFELIPAMREGAVAEHVIYYPSGGCYGKQYVFDDAADLRWESKEEQVWWRSMIGGEWSVWTPAPAFYTSDLGLLGWKPRQLPPEERPGAELARRFDEKP